MGDPFKIDSDDLKGRYAYEQRVLDLLESKKDDLGSYRLFLEEGCVFKSTPDVLQRVIVKCLMYHPWERYGSFDDLLSDANYFLVDPKP